MGAAARLAKLKTISQQIADQNTNDPKNVKQNWIRIGQENDRHYSNIKFEQMYILRKFCRQYGKKIRDCSRGQNVAQKIPEGDLREQDEGLFMLIC